MTSDRQRAANRENARKSTGPRTRAGKAASSSNARRHGVTGALPEDDIVAWYRIIVNDGRAVPDPFETDPCLLAAANLARAEAQLQRVKEAQEKWWLNAQGPSSPELSASEGEKHPKDDLEDDYEMLRDALVENALFAKPLRVAPEGQFRDVRFRRPATIEQLYEVLKEHAHDRSVQVGWDKQGFQLLRRIERRIVHDRLARRIADQKQGARLDRYRSLAEARRHTALRRWIDEITKRPQHSRARDPGGVVQGSPLSAG